MNEPDKKMEERQKLLTNLLSAIKACQVRFGGKSELATENEAIVSNLCYNLEVVLEHGLKQSAGRSSLIRQTKGNNTSTNAATTTFRQMQDLMSNNLGNVLSNSSNKPTTMWSYVKNLLNKHELERYMLLKCVNSDAGRGRAWIRSSLNEHSLERFMHLLVSDANSLSIFYETWAFLRDEERSSMLPTMASGLASILFAITIDKPTLNESANPCETAKNLETNEIIAHKKLLSHPHPETIIATVETQAEVTTSNDGGSKSDSKTHSLVAKKKKRKKPPSQIVLFDKDELRTTRPSPKSSTTTIAIDQVDGSSAKNYNEQENLDNEIRLGEEAGNCLDSKPQSLLDASNLMPDASCLGESSQILASPLLDYESVHLENSDSEAAEKETSLQEKMKRGIDTVRRLSRQSTTVSISSPVDSTFDEDVLDIYISSSTSNKNKQEGSDSNSNLSFDSANTEIASFSGKSLGEGSIVASTMPPKLTPMKNSNVGALTPVVSGTISNRATDKRNFQLEQEEDAIISDDSISIKSFGEDTDYATACNSVSGSNIVSPIPTSQHMDVYLPHTNENNSNKFVGSLELKGINHERNSSGGLNTLFLSGIGMASSSIDKASSCNSKNSSQISTISREDLKQALLSVMSRKDELQEQYLSLKKLLDLEVQKSSSLKEEIESNRRKADETKDKQEARITSLARENELLKHQLKKYVSAVMKLRDGPQAYETLAKLEGDKNNEGNGENKYVDYHFEASEFEKKLIQVAEMHGELLEFNEHLQKVLQAKDAVIRRLREELIDVRGPLPDDEDEGTSPADLVNDSVDIRSMRSREISVCESTGIPAVRPLINIWIPSVFLSGSGSTTHHVYQVYLRIRNEEWNIYRRYSEFYAFHKDLVKKDDLKLVSTFDFPPKKTMGNKAEKVVEDRRKRLQCYLRNIVNLMVHTNPSLAAKPDKEHVLDFFPFFAENFATSLRRRGNVTNQRPSIFANRRGVAASTTEPLAL